MDGQWCHSPHPSAGLANKNDIIYNYAYIIHMWKYCANTTLITHYQ